MIPAFILDEYVKQALQEDIGHGDPTTASIIPDHHSVSAQVVAKTEGILAGLPFFTAVYRLLSPSIECQYYFRDGDPIKTKDILLTLKGPANSILTGERVALNYLQIASGIATYTHQFVQQLAGSKTKICDTRKTRPGLRYLEKYAVTVGGASPHRYGLYDAILIKDNHIAIAGSVTKAIQKAQAYKSHTTKIEVEVETLEQLKEALAEKADIIMLDNMSLENIRQAIQIVQQKAILEISGNITLETLPTYVHIGVDYISTSALVFQAPPLDLSMDICS